MATPNRLIRFFLSILYLIVSTLIIVNLAQRVIGRMAYVVVCCIIFAILDVLRGMDHFIIRTSKRYGLWDYSSSFAFFCPLISSLRHLFFFQKMEENLPAIQYVFMLQDPISS